jgi:hypothetical protein
MVFHGREFTDDQENLASVELRALQTLLHRQKAVLKEAFAPAAG